MFGKEKITTRKTLSINQSVLLIITLVLLGVVIYAGNIMTVNTSKITDVICFASFTFMPISSIICVICFLIPLHSGITGLYIYGYAVLMILIKSKKIKAKVFIALAAIVFYEIVMMIFVDVSQFNYIIVYAITVFLLLYMMNNDDISPKIAGISYICGSIVLLICIFSTAIQNYSLSMVLSGLVRIGDYEGLEEIGKVAVVTENANAMAYYALVAIAIAFSMLKNTGKVGKALLTLAMSVLIILSLFSVSRTFLIVLLILILLGLFFCFDFKQKFKVFAVILLLLAIVIPYLQQQTQIFDAFEARFEDENIATGTGRSNIFKEYMDFLWENPLRLIFGTGAVFYQRVCNLSHSMHNGLQQIFVSYGILGFLPMLGVLISPILTYFKEHKFNLIKILPVLAVLLFTQSIQFLNPNNLMLPYAVAIICMKMPDVEVKL